MLYHPHTRVRPPPHRTTVLHRLDFETSALKMMANVPLLLGGKAHASERFVASCESVALSAQVVLPPSHPTHPPAPSSPLLTPLANRCAIGTGPPRLYVHAVVSARVHKQSTRPHTWPVGPIGLLQVAGWGRGWPKPQLGPPPGPVVLPLHAGL